MKVAESLLFVWLFRAAHNVASWLAYLATKPEDLDRFPVRTYLKCVFSFFFNILMLIGFIYYGKCSKILNTLKLRTPKIITENNF